MDADEEARASYELALQLNEKTPSDVFNALGMLAMKKNDERTAMKNFLKAVEVQPDHVVPLMNIATLLMTQDKLQVTKWSKCAALLILIQDALKWAEKAVKAAPTSADTHVYLAELHSKMKAYKEAEECFQKALTLDGNKASIYQKYGDMKTEIGAHEQAMELFRKAVDEDPRDIESYLKYALFNHLMFEYFIQ